MADPPRHPGDSSQAIELPDSPALPKPLLTSDAAVAAWPSTPGFKGFWGWIQQRCDRIKGREIIEGSYGTAAEAIQHLMRMLDSLIAWVDEVPPQPQSSQRFGNLAFRSYIKLVEEILPLLLNSHAFGHPTRLDYGTGHELAFVLALWCCVVSGWVGAEGREEEEDELVLRVFTRYLDLTTLLQTTYRLEPAGSHGVWGLDDYCFFPYLFGSAQLLGTPLTPLLSLAAALRSTASTTSSIAQSRRSPPASQSDQNLSAQPPPAPTSTSHSYDVIPSSTPPYTDLYTLSLHRLTLFKRGAPFSEHSPLLYSLSQHPSWVKVHGGLRKMFLGEVVGKRVVVQGIWAGGWVWGGEEEVEGTSKKEPAASAAGDEWRRRTGVRGSRAGCGGGEGSGRSPGGQDERVGEETTDMVLPLPLSPGTRSRSDVGVGVMAGAKVPTDAYAAGANGAVSVPGVASHRSDLARLGAVETTAAPWMRPGEGGGSRDDGRARVLEATRAGWTSPLPRR